MPRKKQETWQSEAQTQRAFFHFSNLLREMALSRFTWTNLPETVDVRILERLLLQKGYALFFFDELTQNFYCTDCALGADLNVNYVPIHRRAIAPMGFQRELTIDNSVIIYNMTNAEPTYEFIDFYARRLAETIRTEDINISVQATPFIATGDEDEILTLKNKD